MGLRSMKRSIAKRQMREAGMSKVLKHGSYQMPGIAGKRGNLARTNSYFAENWRGKEACNAD